MMLDRDGIRQRVPHSGLMCLLDGVERWDAQGIVCTAPAVNADHPLATNGQASAEVAVAAVVAAEYAAQAAAVHGALLDGCERARPGMLARLQDLLWTRPVIAADDGALQVHASLLARSESGCVYTFTLDGRRGPLASGRLTVAFMTESQA